MWKCVQCETLNNDDGNYCAVCGEKKPPNNNDTFNDVGYDDYINIDDYSKTNDDEKLRKKLMVIVGILGVVIVVLIAVVGYKIYDLKTNDSDRRRPVSEVHTEAPSKKPKKKYDDESKEEPTESVQTETEEESEIYFNESDDEYIFPSNNVYLSRSQIESLSKDELALLRNEIYARHGYIFKLDEYQMYFERKSWYKPNPYFSEDSFNSIEKANKDLIVEYEQEMGWR